MEIWKPTGCIHHTGNFNESLWRQLYRPVCFLTSSFETKQHGVIKLSFSQHTIASSHCVLIVTELSVMSHASEIFVTSCHFNPGMSVWKWRVSTHICVWKTTRTLTALIRIKKKKNTELLFTDRTWFPQGFVYCAEVALWELMQFSVNFVPDVSDKIHKEKIDTWDNCWPPVRL